MQLPSVNEPRPLDVEILPDGCIVGRDRHYREGLRARARLAGALGELYVGRSEDEPEVIGDGKHTVVHERAAISLGEAWSAMTDGGLIPYPGTQRGAPGSTLHNRATNVRQATALPLVSVSGGMDGAEPAGAEKARPGSPAALAPRSRGISAKMPRSGPAGSMSPA